MGQRVLRLWNGQVTYARTTGSKVARPTINPATVGCIAHGAAQQACYHIAD